MDARIARCALLNHANRIENTFSKGIIMVIEYIMSHWRMSANIKGPGGKVFTYGLLIRSGK